MANTYSFFHHSFLQGLDRDDHWQYLHRAGEARTADGYQLFHLFDMGDWIPIELINLSTFLPASPTLRFSHTGQARGDIRVEGDALRLYWRGADGIWRSFDLDGEGYQIVVPVKLNMMGQRIENIRSWEGGEGYLGFTDEDDFKVFKFPNTAWKEIEWQVGYSAGPFVFKVFNRTDGVELFDIRVEGDAEVKRDLIVSRNISQETGEVWRFPFPLFGRPPYDELIPAGGETASLIEIHEIPAGKTIKIWSAVGDTIGVSILGRVKVNGTTIYETPNGVGFWTGNPLASYTLPGVSKLSLVIYNGTAVDVTITQEARFMVWITIT